MFVTREADYAVRCVLFLAKEKGRVVRAGEISESASIPRSFLAKILQRLSRQGIVKSIQGVSGGFHLARLPSKVNVLEVIETVQGRSAINVCAIDEGKCSLSATCVVHPIWVELRKDVEKKLKRESFARLLTKMKRMEQVEKGGPA
jgi:Rrf2 family protein